MPTYKLVTKPLVLLLLASFLTACGGDGNNSNTAPMTALGATPAVRLAYRYEPDVPTPTLDSGRLEDRNVAVQADFDATRPQELLDRTITSPDKKRVVAVYHSINDVPSEYRLEMYSADGRPIAKMTSDLMAVHFPDTITWSPDSSSVAFVAMIRALPPAGVNPAATPPAMPGGANTNTAAAPTANANTAPDNTEPAEEPSPIAAPTLPAPTGILAFRSEQIYVANNEGKGVKPLTENEGLIYFHYAWSPDSTMLVALATTVREWKYLEIVSGSKGEQMVPQGRLRTIEKNGRERRLDDNLTAVRPVWSPDSTKVAAAFGNQIRLYDAAGNAPTQAAVPLRNQLLLSSQAYDRDQQRLLQNANTGDGAQPTPSPADPVNTLPDERLLVSYNPIVEIAWTAAEVLYLKTAYLRRMRNEADSVQSFARWHRLIFSVQPEATPR